MADEPRTHVLESPLKEWAGSVTLPHPDEFSGLHWQTWRKGVDKPLRASYSRMHQQCYAGLELIKAHGKWELDVPLAVVQSWETEPEEERIKLVAWLGRSILDYMADIIDPKD